MRDFEVVAVVIIAFFVIGIGVGVLFVTALPALRHRRGARSVGRDGEYRRPSEVPPGYGRAAGPGWEEPPGHDDDSNPPRWPGGTSA